MSFCYYGDISPLDLLIKASGAGTSKSVFTLDLLSHVSLLSYSVSSDCCIRCVTQRPFRSVVEGTCQLWLLRFSFPNKVFLKVQYHYQDNICLLSYRSVAQILTFLTLLFKSISTTVNLLNFLPIKCSCLSYILAIIYPIIKFCSNLLWHISSALSAS